VIIRSRISKRII